MNLEVAALDDATLAVASDSEKLEEMLTNVEVVDESEDNSVVRIGSTVRIKDLEYDEEMNYQIVGGSEANTDENMISNESPLGQALIGAVEGDIVNGTLMAGQIAGLVGKEQTCKEMIEEIMAQAERLLGNTAM